MPPASDDPLALRAVHISARRQRLLAPEAPAARCRVFRATQHRRFEFVGLAAGAATIGPPSSPKTATPSKPTTATPSKPSAPALACSASSKANVLFFDRKPASATPWTKTLWIYDLRTIMHFTLKTNPLKCAYPYEDLLARDKASLDLFGLKDDSLESAAALADPDLIAAKIVEDLRTALEEFELIAGDLAATPSADRLASTLPAAPLA